MNEAKIISILKQARSIKPDKQWEQVAREAMLVYIQETPQKRGGFFATLTQWSKAPHLVIGCMLVIIVAIGGTLLIPATTQQIGEQGNSIVPIEVASQTTPQPPTKNETTQDVLSALTATPIPTETIQQITEPEVQPSYSQEATRAFYEYLSSLDTLSEVDETNEEVLQEAIQEVSSRAQIFISLLNIEGVGENEYFEYALRIAVLYRKSQCIENEAQEEITDYLNDNTIASLIEANSLSFQCIKS